MEMVNLEITTFIGGSYGAMHWYAKLKYYNADKEIQHVDIDYPITAGHAKRLNAHRNHVMPGDTFVYQPGMIMNGYESKDEAIEAGKKKYKEMGLTQGLRLGHFATVPQPEETLIEPEKTINGN